MKMRYKFFLILIKFLYFPYFSQAVILPNKPIVANVANRSSHLLQVVPNVCNGPSSSKAEAAALLRKTMRIQAMIQRSWISSMVVPGLGQMYNKDYWKVPCFYCGFFFVCYRIYAEHEEMNRHNRTLLMSGMSGNDQPVPAFTQKRIKECERTRNLFMIIAGGWYLLNIFDAYAGGHNKTVNFKHDITTKSDATAPAVLKQKIK